MDTKTLAEDIQKAIELTKDLPDEYRLKTYEILLTAFVKEKLQRLYFFEKETSKW